MKIFIASDHGGFELKNNLVMNLTSHEISDLGPMELDPEDDYTDYAIKVSEKVLENEGSIGILICRSGIGMSIAANKFKGIYAALCFNEKHAEMARGHNNANVLCLDADYESLEDHLKIVNKFLTSEFEGTDTRHGRRIEKIREIENKE
jgi:ribose 5-phosphate isomerase B